MHLKSKKLIIISTALLIAFAVLFLISKPLAQQLLTIYHQHQSTKVLDRNNQIIAIKPNTLGYYAEYNNLATPEFDKLLLQKEDKYFYYHLGFNPVSIGRSFKNYLTSNNQLASSTITQQLVKILLSNTQTRTLKNKFIESFYALALELNSSKAEILTMYKNSIFLGNNTQGLTSASKLYFNTTPDNLNTEQILQLLATISSPTSSHPFADNNAELANNLAKKFNLSIDKISSLSPVNSKQLKTNFSQYTTNDSNFELNTINTNCQNSCQLTIDQELTNNLRAILQRNIQTLINKNATNGAVVIIKVPENELLTILGSPNPSLDDYGYKINMAIKPRPIGSTVKPFIYLKGFEKNLRPYTNVEDAEYKYTIGTGFAFYPKNYDYKYHGLVNLHYALSNSLNVPTVKVLEYVGLDNFNNFLLNDLEFKPIQDLNNYQLGIALGELEMDLLSLSYYFTIFPNEGKIESLKITNDEQGAKHPIGCLAPTGLCMVDNNLSLSKKLADQKYIQLINKVLSDRKTGIEQFGMKSSLNLLSSSYAVKTGTSRDFHDSWVVGYTPDFVVGVWVGNSQNTPMDAVSGQSGAGQIWHEAMNLLINSEYNHQSAFNFNLIKEYNDNGNIEYGLAKDDFNAYQHLLDNHNLIANPHDQDIFLLEPQMQIPLKARQKVDWFVNDKFFKTGQEIFFTPQQIGNYKIKAINNKQEEVVEIVIDDED